MVKEGDLCPHQDFVHFSRPTNEEYQQILEQRKSATGLYEELREDGQLKEKIKNHPFFLTPLSNLESIYANIEYYIAILVFLADAAEDISEQHLEVIGDPKVQIPEMTPYWMEQVLDFYLFQASNDFVNANEHQKSIVQKLRDNSAIEHRRISLAPDHGLNKLLASSVSKLDSIVSIVGLEQEQLSEKLRLVILTDYIRKEFLGTNAESPKQLNKIGVVSIFEKLRRDEQLSRKLGILTGSLIVIPATALEAFNELAARQKLTDAKVKALEIDERYFELKVESSWKEKAVQLITELFQNGDIEVLVGTKALLGEGWDAPRINSLILASFVGSFVLSNQMRGRAIRAVRDQKEKTGNIWHLVCIDPEAIDGGQDLKLLQRRFRTFVGLTNDSPARITDGIYRLGLGDFFNGTAEIAEANRKMVALASSRATLTNAWKGAIRDGSELCEAIRIPYPKERNYEADKTFWYKGTIRFAALTMLMGMSECALYYFFRFGKLLKSYQGLTIAAMLVLGLTGVTFAGKSYRTLKMYIGHRDISKDVYKIADALLVSLRELNYIKTSRTKLELTVNVDPAGVISCDVRGCERYEENIFLKAMSELLGPVANPRYIIIRKSKAFNILDQRDYHNVPEILGTSKKQATLFAMNWTRMVGTCSLIFTRNLEGRKVLLAARLQALSANFVTEPQRMHEWR